MGKTISKRRLEMGEEAWAAYQKARKNRKTKTYSQTENGRRLSLKVILCRRRNKRRLIEYKGGKCERCGYDKPIWDAYDFHHLDPTEKEFGIGGKEGKNYSLAKMKKEADKCILVCSNCHREIHYLEKIAAITKEAQELDMPIDGI